MADEHKQTKRIIQVTRINPESTAQSHQSTWNPNFIFVKMPKDGQKTQQRFDAMERDDEIDIKPISYNSEACSNHFQPQLIKTETEVTKDDPTMEIPLSDHFKPSSFAAEDIPSQSNETFQHHRLTKCKIKYELEDDDKIDEDTNELTFSQLLEMPTVSKETLQEYVNTQSHSSGSFLSEEMLKKVNAVKDYELKITSLEKELSILKEKVLPNKMYVSNDDFTRTMCELVHWKNQMKVKYKNRQNSTEFKMFALNLYVFSRQIYKKLSSSLNLPNVNELKHLKLHLSSELNHQNLDCLHMKLNSLPDKAKYCTLTIDTIDLKRHLYYNIKEDEIIGLHNFKGHATNVTASTVYYVMLNGIAFDWQQPIAYIFLANKTEFAELDYWINQILLKLFNMDIHILAITSSQEPVFNDYAEYKGVNVEKPFFSAHRHNIYYIFDAPHLLTSLRNNLIDYDFYYENQKISWSHIEALYAYKKLKLLNVLPKIKDAHVTPSALEKKEFKYAAQIFSLSVFSTFDILMSVNFIPKEALLTAKFIKTINDLFDVLNSNEITCDNELKSAFTKSSTQMETLLNASKMIQKVHVVNKQNKFDVTRNISTMKNITITIHALILLSNHLQEYGIQQILTRRLNKEFSDSFKNELNITDEIIKTTAIKFLRAFKKTFLLQLLKTKVDKFRGDLCEVLLQKKSSLHFYPRSDSTKNDPSVFALREITQIEPSTTPVPLQGDCDYRFQLPKRDAFTYVAGYLLFKCSKKHKCPDFDAVLSQCPSLKLDENINVVFSFYKRLKVPPPSFCNIIRKFDDIFVSKFSEAAMSKPATKMLDLLRNVYFVPLCACFPIDYLLALFVRFKIHSILIQNKNVPCETASIIVVNAL